MRVPSEKEKYFSRPEATRLFEVPSELQNKSGNSVCYIRVHADENVVQHKNGKSHQKMKC
jgi:hypothetical protein